MHLHSCIPQYVQTRIAPTCVDPLALLNFMPGWAPISGTPRLENLMSGSLADSRSHVHGIVAISPTCCSQLSSLQLQCQLNPSTTVTPSRGRQVLGEIPTDRQGKACILGPTPLQGSGVRACIFTAGVLELEPSPCAFEFAVCSASDYADLEAKRSWTANTYSACMLSRS